MGKRRKNDRASEMDRYRQTDRDKNRDCKRKKDTLREREKQTRYRKKNMHKANQNGTNSERREWQRNKQIQIEESP